MRTNRLMTGSVRYKGSCQAGDQPECRIDFSPGLHPRTDRPIENGCNVWHGFLNSPIPIAGHMPATSGGEGKPAVLTTRNYNCSIDRNTTFSTITIASSIAITHLFKIFKLKEDALDSRRGIRWRHY